MGKLKFKNEVMSVIYELSTISYFNVSIRLLIASSFFARFNWNRVRLPSKMNAQSQTLELALEGYQVEEAVTSIFHTVLFHRSFGKFHYQEDGNYLEGTIGYTDVDCDFIDLTYIRCSSPILDQNIKMKVSAFSEELRSSENVGSGEISLKFFRKKKMSWPFQPECIPWEIWNVHLDLIKLNNEHEKQLEREKMGEMLAEKLVCITELVNRCQFMPDVPSQADLCLVFDLSYDDCQPYLHEIAHISSTPATPSFSSVFRSVFR